MDTSYNDRLWMLACFACSGSQSTAPGGGPESQEMVWTPTNKITARVDRAI